MKSPRFAAASMFPLAVALSTVAYGQGAAPPPTDGDDALSEIVVTAQKRAQNLQQVPIAITAASGEDIQSRGITSTFELSAIAPGLNIRTASGAIQTFIRGIGTTSNVVENPVALYIDGVYLPQQRDGLRDLVDVEQVAVLKGPQGTLFGRNATGGVVQITTLAPQQEFSGQIRAEIDNYTTVRTRAYVTGGLTDTISASASVGYASQGKGFGDAIATGNDTNRLRHEFSARAKILFKPGQRTEIMLIGDYLNRNQLANSFQPYPGTLNRLPGVGPIKSAYDSYQGADSFIAYEGGGANLTIDHDFDFAKLVSISAWRKGNTRFLFDNAAVPTSLFLVSTPRSPNRMYSQELQLVSTKNEQFNWVAGVFLFDYLNESTPILRQFAGPLAALPTATASSITNGFERTRSIAPFGQITWQFLPDTNLTVGGRYTIEERRAQVTQVATRVNGTTATIARDEALTIRKPTYRVAIDHQFTPEILGYMSFNTGIKSGGFNIINPSPGYLPEELKAYEIGFKSEIFDRRLRLNVAGYYYDYTNIQVSQFVGVAQTVVNGAKARLYGIDIDFVANVASGLRLTGGMAFAHTEFVDYRNAVFSTPVATGGATVFAGNATGNRLPLAQKFSGTVAIDYRHTLQRGAVDLNLTLNHNGAYFFEADNFLRQGAYTIANASVKWTLPDDRTSLTIFARNLFDEHVITQATTQAIGYPAAYSNTPFSVGAAVDFKF